MSEYEILFYFQLNILCLNWHFCGFCSEELNKFYVFHVVIIIYWLINKCCHIEVYLQISCSWIFYLSWFILWTYLNGVLSSKESTIQSTTDLEFWSEILSHSNSGVRHKCFRPHLQSQRDILRNRYVLWKFGELLITVF